MIVRNTNCLFAVVLVLLISGCGSSGSDSSCAPGAPGCSPQTTNTLPGQPGAITAGGIDSFGQGAAGGGTGEVSSDAIWDFLWKPDSESTGNLVILVNPPDIRVEVVGSISETLVNTGSSNGRGTTARASVPGCAFGDDVKVYFFDASGDQVYLENGRSSVTIPDGCNRHEFKL